MQLSLFEKSVLEGVKTYRNTQGCYHHVAYKNNLSEQDMQNKVRRGKDILVSFWRHKIRQTQQCLKSKGLIVNTGKRNGWNITTKGQQQLTTLKPDLFKLYFSTKNGMAFWGDSKHLPSLFDNEINLIVTSPPYLLSNNRDYASLGNSEKDYVNRLVEAVESWLPLLTPTASIVLNLGDGYKKGYGYQSLHKERLLIALEDKLGLHLVQKFRWWSPNKMPNGYWTTIAKKHCVNAVEDFFWLSLDPKVAKADNQKVLVEYSDKQKHYLSAAYKKSAERKLRPSNNSSLEASFYADNGGAIPHNLLMGAPEGANSAYSKFCKEAKLPRHPAMFNYSLPEFFIRYLTDSGDVVLDPYSGSGNTAYASELNDRHWISSDITKEYLDGHIGRMQSLTSVQTY